MLDTGELFDAIGGNRQKQPDEDIITRLRFDDSLEVPIELTDLEMWSNYINDDLYVMDSKVREFLKRTRYKREKDGGYKTTASVIFAWIYGRKPTSSDGAACRMLHELLRYYCTSYSGPTTFNGKKVAIVYRFSRYATTNRRPYSLRLRLEEAKDGQNPWRRSAGDHDKKVVGRRRKDRVDGEDADERGRVDIRG